MTDWREAQRRSFAFGNCNIENPKVTREIVKEEAEKMRIAVRTTELSGEQELKEQVYRAAVEILCKNGINARYVPCVVCTPTDDVGYIKLGGEE